MELILIIYLICHTPAFVLLGVGLAKRKTQPQTAKVLLILAGIYFLIGGGICGLILSDFPMY